jgi:uncharacterized protein (TIGR03083 family)
MDYDWYCDHLENEGAHFIDVARHAEDVAVPSCPQWRVADLLAHVGFVHRWSEYVVRHRAPERLSVRDMGLSRGPVTPEWLGDGLATLLATLRASDPDDAMWAWGADQHVRFWARRQLHETLVHRVDLEGALGAPSEIDPVVAADAIDEFLENLERAGVFSPEVKNLVGAGEIITFRTHEGREWALRLTPEGFELVADAGPSAATLRGPATDLLLVLYRRRRLDESTCTFEGSRELLDRWLTNSALL